MKKRIQFFAFLAIVTVSVFTASTLSANNTEKAKTSLKKQSRLDPAVVKAHILESGKANITKRVIRR